MEQEARQDFPTMPASWASLRKQLAALAAQQDGNDDSPVNLQQMFSDMLERLCTQTGVSAADRREIMTSHEMLLDNCAVAFQLDECSAFAKVYIDIGEPMPAYAHEMYRYFLVQQLYMPAPFQMLVGLHPESSRFTLCACMPLPTDEEGDARFMALIKSGLMVVNLLRSDLAGQSLAMNPD
jgi:hypothetical protein